MAEKMILNIAGQPRSGKDTVARHLRDTYDFAIYSPSDTIRSYAVEHDIPLHNRADFSQTRLRMMAENPDIMVNGVLDTPADRVCVSGLRLVYLAQQLSERRGAKMIALDCSSWTRYQRSLTAEDSVGKEAGSYKDFLQQEFAEYRSDDPLGTATASVMELADYRIDAEADTSLVLTRVDEIVEPLLQQFAEGR